MLVLGSRLSRSDTKLTLVNSLGLPAVSQAGFSDSGGLARRLEATIPTSQSEPLDKFNINVIRSKEKGDFSPRWRLS